MSQREPFRVRSLEKLLIKQAADMYSHTHEHSATAAINEESELKTSKWSVAWLQKIKTLNNFHNFNLITKYTNVASWLAKIF